MYDEQKYIHQSVNRRYVWLIELYTTFFSPHPALSTEGNTKQKICKLDAGMHMELQGTWRWTDGDFCSLPHLPHSGLWTWAFLGSGVCIERHDSIVVKSVGSGFQLTGSVILTTWHYLTTVWSWTSYLTSLTPKFFFSKMEIIDDLFWSSKFINIYKVIWGRCWL